MFANVNSSIIPISDKINNLPISDYAEAIRASVISTGIKQGTAKFDEALAVGARLCIIFPKSEQWSKYAIVQKVKWRLKLSELDDLGMTELINYLILNGGAGAEVVSGFSSGDSVRGGVEPWSLQFVYKSIFLMSALMVSAGVDASDVELAQVSNINNVDICKKSGLLYYSLKLRNNDERYFGIWLNEPEKFIKRTIPWHEFYTSIGKNDEYVFGILRGYNDDYVGLVKAMNGDDDKTACEHLDNIIKSNECEYFRVLRFILRYHETRSEYINRDNDEKVVLNFVEKRILKPRQRLRVYYALASFYFLNGDMSLANKYWQNAYSLYERIPRLKSLPESIILNYAIARQNLIAGESDLAVEILSGVVGSIMNSGSNVEVFWNKYLSMLEEMPYPKKSLLDEKLLAIFVNIEKTFGDTLFLAKKYKAAKDAYLRALKRDANNSVLEWRIFEVMRELGEVEGAEKFIEDKWSAGND